MKKSVGVFSTYERVIGGSWCVTGVESHLSHLKFHEDHFTMAPKKRVGIGAECTVSLHFLQPKNKVKVTIPNQTSTQKLSSLIVQSKEKKTIHREEKDCIVFQHEDFNEPIWCLSSYVKVDVEGPEETFFPLETHHGGGGGGQAAQEGQLMAVHWMASRTKTTSSHKICPFQSRSYSTTLIVWTATPLLLQHRLHQWLTMTTCLLLRTSQMSTPCQMTS